jgi:serine/threonine protein kinase
MTPVERCPECGGPLMAGSQEGMCARCLLAAALRNPADAAPAALPTPGEWIGSYRIVRLLGEGGMGMVYLARQEQPIARQVALKVIKLGMDTRAVLSRFQSEGQALVLMDHPTIAKVFDAGSTPLISQAADASDDRCIDLHMNRTANRLRAFSAINGV